MAYRPEIEDEIYARILPIANKLNITPEQLINRILASLETIDVEAVFHFATKPPGEQGRRVQKITKISSFRFRS